MNGVLVLEDGRFFRGWRFGGAAGGAGEVVFNTSATGYQEILTDPSYEGQIAVLTSSHVGNYGVNPADPESLRLRAQGLVVRDHHRQPSNWRAERSLHDELSAAGVPGLSGADTRALTQHLRDAGAKRGVLRDMLPKSCLPLGGYVEDWAQLAAADSGDLAQLRDMVDQARAVAPMAGCNLAERVTCTRPWTSGADDARWHVVAVDFGIKHGIVRELVARDCRVTVVPAQFTAPQIIALRPDGVLLSNGPGDPEPLQDAVATIAELLGKVPIFGICLGHQLLALALGGRTFKLKFGHRGGNHPVRDALTGRIEMTSQNHGFAVLGSSVDSRMVQITHRNLNDDTVEGLRHKLLPAFSVQFHPEASPGPRDARHLFDRFTALMAQHPQQEG